MITKRHIEELPAGMTFMHGEFIDAPQCRKPYCKAVHANVANTGKTVRFVAVRGDIPDWAIYCQNPHYVESDDPEVLAVGYGGVWDWEKIRQVGDKVHDPENIKRLVPCDDEALKMYRH